MAILLLCFLAAALLPQQAGAQLVDVEPARGDSAWVAPVVVITATRDRDNALEVPAAATTVDAASLGQRYWSDRDLRRLPYDKGALLAMLIDLELRRAGAGDLVGFVAFLRDDNASRAAPLTNAALRDALERYSGMDWHPFWDDAVLGASWLPVFETLSDVGLRVVERLVPAPWYGLRTNVTADGAWYVSEVVAGSPAAAAGLVAGQALAQEPIVPDDRSGRPIEVIIRASGREVPVRITPSTGQRRGFVLVEDDDDTTDYRAAFGL